MKKVVFLDTVHPVLSEKLTENGFKCLDGSLLSKEMCLKEIKSAFGIVIRSRFKIDRVFLKEASNIEFIARSGSGMENIDLNYCKENNIAVFNSPEGNKNAVGEHCLGLLLNLMNHISKGNKEIKNGIWDREGNRGEELEGKTVGIIGYGHNGMSFAEKLNGFNVNIIAYDKYKTGFSDGNVKEVSLKEIFKLAHVVSFHIPQNKETKGFANKSFFKKFNHPIYLLNISRGKIINTEDLVSAIDLNLIKGAALDVLEYEPSSFEPFLEVIPENLYNKIKTTHQIILTPHVAGWTKESYYKLSNVLANKVLNHYQK